MSERRFYFLSMDRTKAEGERSCVWWRHEGLGYTTRIAEAGIFGDDDLWRADGHFSLAIPVESVELPAGRAAMLAKRAVKVKR